MLRRGGMDGNDPSMARFPANGAAVATALAFARRFAEAHALAADDAARLAIIVEELVANLIDHGGAPGTSITLRLSRRSREIGLTLIDRGAFFDLRTAQHAAEPPERGGGAGIALVLAWARVDDYTRAGTLNWLDLTIPLTG